MKFKVFTETIHTLRKQHPKDFKHLVIESILFIVFMSVVTFVISLLFAIFTNQV
jgi:hypothetical protein